ncbi:MULTISPECIES: TRAP transporter small permease [unclassified Uliginosibacterium]|uniref:TRAP transporter small permease n=1 Tax=unclassified Uliginosibacterium TaxID=2621521 RepID=UPI000C7D37FB|nr:MULTISPECIES: TRAP transporter small permease [unclassified Uliginosibacterium]MDO6384799.1 TRAP transporter small permease [Uliginosibacterium sp. 31-12]PLK48485.1 TRAP transporter permease DctQ [Uliginosibacterium sp. TH139]
MKILDHLEEWLIASLIGAATLIIFLAVVHRYLAGIEIPYLQDWLLSLHLGWAQELTIIMFVWMAKFGAAYGVRTGIHVGVDVAINALPERIRNRFILFGLFAGALFTAIICVLGSRLVWGNGLNYEYNQLIGSTEFVPEGPVTPDLEWPTWAVFLAVPLGSALMCFRFLQVAWSFWRSGELPHHDHGAVAGLDDEAEGSRA